MNRLKLASKSLAYSWNLIFESSKFMIFLYFALMLITTSFPLLSAFLLKYVLDALTVARPEIEKVLTVVVIYGLSLVVNQGITSAKDLVKSTIDQKARHLYQCRLVEKLSELPMDVLDSSKGKDQIDEVRYMEFTSVYLIFRLTDIISFLYTFVVAFTTLAVFSLGFSLMFLAFTIPSIIFNEYYARKSEELREKTAPDVRKFHYYRWMLTDAWPAKDVRMYDLTDAIKDSEYMILDEPSAALDPISEDRIFEQLYHLSEGKSSVTISHRLSNTTLADKILVISDGHIIEQGSHFELLKQNEKYAELFNLQASKYI